MNSLSFTIPGRPVPWARAGSKGGHRYTPAKQKEHAALVLREALKHADSLPTFTRPVWVRVWFTFLPSKKPKFNQFHGVKPDLDNLVKQILDALNGRIIADDCLVTRIDAAKQYRPYEQTHVEIQLMED